jgi:hypothetical protein
MMIERLVLLYRQAIVFYECFYECFYGCLIY